MADSDNKVDETLESQGMSPDSLNESDRRELEDELNE